MKPIHHQVLAGLALALLLFAVPSASPQTPPPGEKGKPTIAVTEDMGDAMARQAAAVRAELAKQASSLFERKPLGWDLGTVQDLYGAIWLIPKKANELMGQIIEQSRVLGVVGSLLVLFFVAVTLYSLIGQERVLRWVERRVQPLGQRIPEGTYAYFQSILKVVVSALIPLVLLGLFSLIDAMLTYRAAWFLLVGRLLVVWAVGALILRLLKEALTRELFKTTAQYGKEIYLYARMILLFTLIGVAVSWGASVFKVPAEVLALLRFAVSLSITVILFVFFLKKRAYMSLFPDFPYRGYRWFIGLLRSYYYPLLMVSFLAALLWCFGYRELGRSVLTKIWFTLGAFLAIMLVYHSASAWIAAWSRRLDHQDEAARRLVRSLRSLLVYLAALVTGLVVLDMLGLLDPLQRIMSFPMFQLGETQVNLWIIFKALFILLLFVFASRLLQDYMDYKVYPSLGIEPGLGYALNTFFKYLSLAVGVFISLRLVGIDLRFLLVFAGAAGIGIGLGLQNMAANIISGFSIIFGGKIRRGDWIQAGDTMGVVVAIYLRATKVRTRDNIEYLVPNANLISNTIVNYSLSSPLIRIELPVGVSYNADPREVERILLKAAEDEVLVSKAEKPLVRFVGYGDSSINFELLIWIDVRRVARRAVRSALYFTIFDELKKASIEIPFPQRDIHIRTPKAASIDSITPLPGA
jgi:small-conductance mechanosensitive channel